MWFEYLSRRTRAPWVLTLVLLLLLLPGTSALPLVDRDEPRFVRATVEMMKAGEWVVPTFGGQPRFDKPILSYWLMRAGMTLLGQIELGARLFSVVCAWGLVLLTWHVGCRWFGARVGFIAGFALASCLQVFIHGRLALADMPMVTCVAVSLVALAELLRLAPEDAPAGPPVRFWWWALYGALGLGFLAKGPIALAVPAVVLLLFRFACWRVALPWSCLRAGSGLLITLTLVAAWGIPALLATRGQFFAVGVGEHVVKRGLERYNHRGYNPLFYLGTAPLSLFPWIGFAGLAVVAARRRWSKAQAWLVAWWAAPYLIFTPYATQLAHYVLPAFPAFFLLLAQGFELDAPRWRKLGLVVATGFGCIAALVAVALGLCQPPVEASSLRSALVFGLIAVSGLTLLPRLVVGLRPWLGWAGLLAVAVGAAGMGHHARRVHLAVGLADASRAVSPETRLIGSQLAEPSLLYYAGRAWWFPRDERDLAEALAAPGPVQVVALRRECEPMTMLFGSARWRELPEPPALNGWPSRVQAGFNFGRSRWQEIRIYTRPQ